MPIDASRSAKPPNTATAAVIAWLRIGFLRGSITVDDFRREGYLRGRLPGISGTRVDDVVAADDVGAGNAGLRLLSEIQFDVVDEGGRRGGSRRGRLA